MKLRNKKTGEIVEADYISVARSGFDVVDKDGNIIAKNIHTLPLCYSSVRELTSEFEDYTPKQPLIEDKKLRKAVRAWADYNGVEEVTYFESEDDGSRLVCHSVVIDFYEYIDGLEDYKKYTIAELCGEEE